MTLLKERQGAALKGAPCAKEGCREKALSLSEFCWEHIPDTEAYKRDIVKALKEKRHGGFILQKTILKGLDLTKSDFSGANLTQANLSKANLFDVDFSNADLVGTDLSESDLTGANLSGADLTKACLKGARLWNADLSGAKLVEADMSGSDLWQADLYNSRLWRADISNVKALAKNNFMDKHSRLLKVYRIHEKGFTAAEETYRSLKRYFIDEGRYNDASWASFREKTMEKLKLKKERDPAYMPLALMGLLCGYGEKPQRIIFSSLFIILIYAVGFYLTRCAVSAAAAGAALTFGDYLYYSVVTFTTLGYGDIIPRAHTAYRLFAVSEAFFGAFLMGLFIFTLARKYSAR